MRPFRVSVYLFLTVSCADAEEQPVTASLDPATQSAGDASSANTQRDAPSADASSATAERDAQFADPLDPDTPVSASPACEHRHCDPLLVCPSGCTRNLENVCVDAGGARCDGCPERASIGESDACATPGQSCYYPPACGGDEAICAVDDQGVARWVILARSCESLVAPLDGFALRPRPP